MGSSMPTGSISTRCARPIRCKCGGESTTTPSWRRDGKHVNRIFIPAGGHPLDRDMVDSKGFAWLDSVMPRDIRFDTLASLDTLDPHAFETPGRHIRHLEGHWWLYRWIGARERD